VCPWWCSAITSWALLQTLHELLAGIAGTVSILGLGVGALSFGGWVPACAVGRMPNLLIVWVPFDRYIQGAEHVRTVCMGAYGWGGLVFLLVKSQGKESLAILAQVRGVFPVWFLLHATQHHLLGWLAWQAPAIVCVLVVCLLNFQALWARWLLGGLVLLAGAGEIRKAYPNGLWRFGPDDGTYTEHTCCCERFACGVPLYSPLRVRVVLQSCTSP